MHRGVSQVLGNRRVQLPPLCENHTIWASNVIIVAPATKTGTSTSHATAHSKSIPVLSRQQSQACVPMPLNPNLNLPTCEMCGQLAGLQPRCKKTILNLDLE